MLTNKQGPCLKMSCRWKWLSPASPRPPTPHCRCTEDLRDLHSIADSISLSTWQKPSPRHRGANTLVLLHSLSSVSVSDQITIFSHFLFGICMLLIRVLPCNSLRSSWLQQVWVNLAISILLFLIALPQSKL